MLIAPFLLDQELSRLERALDELELALDLVEESDLFRVLRRRTDNY